MPGNNIILNLPTSSDNWPSWATKVVNAFVAVQNDIGPAVGFSKLIADGDLNLGNYGITNANYVQFRQGTTAPPTPGIGCNGTEIYVTDGAGRVIQLTNAGAINIAGVGGFTNEYISAAAQAKYTNGTSLYEFLTAAGAAYANIKALTFQTVNGANAVTIKFGGAANYNFILPTALPGATALLSMDATGQLATAATIGTGVTFNNANITFTGTSDQKHPDRTRYEPAAALHMQVTAGAGSYQYSADGHVTNNAAAGSHYFRIPGLRANERLKSVRVSANKADLLGTALTLRKWTNGVSAVIANGNLPAANGAQNATITVGAPASSGVDDVYVLEVAWTVTVGNITYSIGWTVDNT